MYDVIIFLTAVDGFIPKVHWAGIDDITYQGTQIILKIEEGEIRLPAEWVDHLEVRWIGNIN